MTSQDFVAKEMGVDLKKFYSDPMHWSNNKRRMHGLGPLRGKSNFWERRDALLCFNYYFEDLVREYFEQFLQQLTDVRDVKIGIPNKFEKSKNS